MAESGRPSCWIVTEGHVGMDNQCIGLAEAAGLAYRMLPMRVPGSLRWLPSRWWPRPLALGADGPYGPPWPQVLIGCGRCSVPVLLAVRRASGDRTFTVFVQDPHTAPERFDLVVVPHHDRTRGPNVVVTRGATHRVTAEVLQGAAARFRARLAHLPSPRVAVLIGGSNRRQVVSPQVVATLTERLRGLCTQHGAGLMVTPSRRTGAANEAALRAGLAGLAAEVWDGSGENPYFGYLGLADAVVVTADSVSMVSEACSTGKPVYVYELEGASGRLRRFHEQLRAQGVTRPFTGALERWCYAPLDDTQRAARELRERLAAHHSSEG